MRRISVFRDLFEADAGEKIIVTVESKNVPHSVTFSAGPAFTDEELPPPRERKSFTMDATNPSFTIVYFFPPPAARDPQAHYLVSFNGKAGTSDGPNKIEPLSSNSVTQLYEFRVPAAAPAAIAKKAAPPKAKTAAPPPTASIEDLEPVPSATAAKPKPKTKAAKKKNKTASPAKPARNKPKSKPQ